MNDIIHFKINVKIVNIWTEKWEKKFSRGDRSNFDASGEGVIPPFENS